MIKTLDNILRFVEGYNTFGPDRQEVTGICFDSRKVQEGNVFVAVKGVSFNGHHFIQEAIAKGANTIVCEKLPEHLISTITYIQTGNSSITLGLMLKGYYDDPSSKLTLVGVTGTNGKTTIATLLYNLFQSLGYPTGLLSTIENRIEDTSYPATHTTPDIVYLNQLLSEMVEKSCKFCFMEVSSHAIDQDRTAGLLFKGGIFTNLTHDHLDYHKTYSAYLTAKKKFFDHLSDHSFALTNIDDKNGEVIIQNCEARSYTYGLKKMADFKGKILDKQLDGMMLTLNNREVWTRLTGSFNAYNLLAVFATAIILDEDENIVLEKLSNLSSARGRFEVLQGPGNKTAIIDYAHTPDALLNIIKTLHDVKRKSQAIITVVGAGGDRDKSKRPEMGEIAGNFSDKVIFTSDNPRSEDPEVIIKEMTEGVPIDKRSKVISIASRLDAIKTANLLAAEGDIILIAGKGHETYQVVGDKKYHFDDKEVIMDIWNLNNEN